MKNILSDAALVISIVALCVSIAGCVFNCMR